MKTTTNNLFTHQPGNLLFFKTDVKNLDDKNDPEKAVIGNNNLNKIKALLVQKNIKLIVLVCPDKYDLYYPYIQDKKKFPKPLFFSLFSGLEKDYIYINSFSILSNEIKKTKNVYYYDDTHWSPISSKIIGAEIEKVVNENKKE